MAGTIGRTTEQVRPGPGQTPPPERTRVGPLRAGPGGQVPVAQHPPFGRQSPVGVRLSRAAVGDWRAVVFVAEILPFLLTATQDRSTVNDNY